MEHNKIRELGPRLLFVLGSLGFIGGCAAELATCEQGLGVDYYGDQPPIPVCIDGGVPVGVPQSTERWVVAGSLVAVFVGSVASGDKD